MEPVQHKEPTVEMPNMAAYGVSADDWTGLPWAWALERLVANRNYWVVTVSTGGAPHAMPVWGVWDASRNVFGFSCAQQSAKLRNLRANAHVAVTVSDTVECVSVQGIARLLEPSSPALFSIVEQYTAKYGNEVPGDLAEFVRANALIEVIPSVAFGVIEREAEFAARATRWRF